MPKGVEQMTVDYSLAKTTGQAISQSDTDRSARVYDLIRPLIFRMQPETAHHVTLALLRMGGAVAPARGLLQRGFPTHRSRSHGAGVRPDLPQRGRIGRGVRQRWPRLARPGCPRLRPHRGWHRDPTAAGRQPRPAHLPAGGRSGGDQPHGLPQPRRRVCGAAAGWETARRPDPGRQYRQEPDHLTGARGRGLSQPGDNLCARSPTTWRST